MLHPCSESIVLYESVKKRKIILKLAKSYVCIIPEKKWVRMTESRNNKSSAGIE